MLYGMAAIYPGWQHQNIWRAQVPQISRKQNWVFLMALVRNAQPASFSGKYCDMKALCGAYHFSRIIIKTKKNSNQSECQKVFTRVLHCCQKFGDQKTSCILKPLAKFESCSLITISTSCRNIIANRYLRNCEGFLLTLPHSFWLGVEKVYQYLI